MRFLLARKRTEAERMAFLKTLHEKLEEDFQDVYQRKEVKKKDKNDAGS